MPKFRIIASRPQLRKTFEDHPEFDVELIDGNLEVGQGFELKELYTRCKYKILEISGNGALKTIKVDRPIPWEEFHIGEVLSI